MGEFIPLSYDPICVSGTDRITWEGEGGWGQIGQIFPKTRLLDRTSFFIL